MDTNTVQPGQTVSPTPPQGQDTDKPADQPAPKQPEPTPKAAPEPPAQPQVQPPAPARTGQTPEEASTAGADSSESAITWTASEFIAHAKSFGWYAALALGAVVVAILFYLVTKDPVPAGVVIFGALLLGIYGGHKPRELQYRLDPSGLSIGQKHFGYDEFRSFSVLPEGAFSSIVFMPLRRFAVPTTIYYAPEDEKKIVSLLGDRLPLERRRHDATDRLMHKIHF